MLKSHHLRGVSGAGGNRQVFLRRSARGRAVFPRIAPSPARTPRGAAVSDAPVGARCLETRALRARCVARLNPFLAPRAASSVSSEAFVLDRPNEPRLARMRRVPRPDPSPALPAQTPRPSVSHESDLSDKSRASLACASPAVSIDHLPLPPLDDLDLPDLVGEGPDDVLGDLAFDALPGVPVACFDDATFPTPGDAQHPHGGGETTDSGVRSAADAAAETQSSDETARRGDRGPAASSADDEKQRERLVRNRESAQQSRQRKKQYLDDLERRCRALSRANGELHRACASLVAECNGLRHHLALATGKPPVPPGVVLPHPTPPEIRALAAEAGPAKIPLFPQNAAPGNANATAFPHPTRVALAEAHLEGCAPPLQDPTASSKPSSSASGSAPGSPESAAKRRRKMPAGFAGDNNKKTASVAAAAAGAMGALACVACVAGLRGASEPRGGVRMIAAGSSRRRPPAPATTHRRRLLEDADSDARIAARILRPGGGLRGGRTIPPLPPSASPGLRRLSALRGGAYASEADGSGLESVVRIPIRFRAASGGASASGSGQRHRRWRFQRGGATSAAATPMIWETSGDPPRIPRRRRIPRTPARTTLGTPRSGRLG